MAIDNTNQPPYVKALTTWTQGPRSWTGNAGQGTTVYYTFDQTKNFQNRSDATALSDPEKTAARVAMDYWQAISGIKFVEDDTQYKMVFAKLNMGDLGWAPVGSLSGSKINSNDVFYNDSGLQEGESGFQTFLHEISHAIGISHPGGGTGNNQGWNMDFTTLSYNNGGVANSVQWPSTPMIYDIAAAQYLYGVNRTTSTGFGGNNSPFTLTGDQKAWTLWDGGGTGDTLKVDVTETRDAVLDLRGGVGDDGKLYWSHVGNEYVAIAFDPANASGVVEIENATGGKGNDALIGNNVNNILIGNKGNDLLSGGNGQDSLEGGDDNDVLWGGKGVLYKWAHQYTDSDFGAEDFVRDTLNGGKGNDTIYAGANDTGYGNDNNDTIYTRNGGSADGGIGSDHLYALDGGTLSGGGDSDYLEGKGAHLIGDSGADIFGFSNGAFVDDATTEDFISWAGGMQITGGVQQWWMEGGWAYYAPISSIADLGGFFPEFLAAVSVVTDLSVGPLFRFGLTETNQLIIQSGRGRTGQMVIENYQLDLEEATATANVVAFKSQHLSGEQATLSEYKDLVGLTIKAGFGYDIPNGDPLIVDLGGDGLDLTRQRNSNVYFDFDGDGFAENMAWVKATDGFLVRDLNADSKITGNEMFGSASQTGLAALKAAADTNGDNKVNSSDSIGGAWASLKIWQDTNQNGITDAGELKTLAQAGIKEISVVGQTPSSGSVKGNTVTAEATFTRTDNTTGKVGDVRLVNNETDTHYLGNSSISGAAGALPALKGYGTLPDLQISMTNDATLLSQVNSFKGMSVTTTWTNLKAAADDILFKWAGVQSTTPTAIGSGGFDAQKLAFLEKYFGYELTPRTNGMPSAANAAQLLESWNTVLDDATIRLASQGPLSSVLGGTAFTVDEDHFLATGATALGDAISLALAKLSATPSTALSQWNTSWAPILKEYADAMIRHDQNEVHDDYLLQALVKAMDGKTLALTLSQLAGGFNLAHDHIGTGLTRDAGTDSHQYIGTAGNDTMTGGTGQDVYIFGRTFGNDTIIDSDSAESGDRIRLAVYNPDDVTIKRIADDLVVRVTATGNTITVKGHYEAPLYDLAGLPITSNKAIEDIQFADGTIYEAGDISAKVGLGTNGADTIIGTAFADEIEGLKGDDTLDGGVNGDTYYFTNGDGKDVIRETAGTPTANAPDVLALLGTIHEEDLRFTRDGKSDDLTITFANAATDSIVLQDQFKYTALGFDTKLAINSRIEIFMFEQGGITDWLDIQDKVIQTYTTDGNDITYGFGTSDTLYASTGDDSLMGGDGGDEYRYEIGSGNDTIYDQSRTPETFISGLVGYHWGADDVLRFGEGISASDVTFTGDSNADLHIQFANSTNEIIIVNQFHGTKLDLFNLLGVAWFDRVEKFQFADGTTLTWEDVLKKATTGTSGNDSLYGAWYNDILDGGAGNDFMAGGDQSDTYYFGRGYGQDTIKESRGSILSTNQDVLRFKSNGNTVISESDVVFSRDPNHWGDLLISIKNTTDTLRIQGQFDTVYTGVFGEQTFNRIENFIWENTNGQPVITKSWETISQEMLDAYNRPVGEAIFGTNADDHLDGGAGNDTMNGGNGGDTYVFRAGYGHDVIYDKLGNVFADRPDFIEFQAVNPDDVIITRLGKDLSDALITISGNANDSILISNNFTSRQYNSIENFVFKNNAGNIVTTWDYDYVLSHSIAQSETDGNDTINGFPNNDIFSSSRGNDLIIGDSGSDTYNFSKGFGNDIIVEDSYGNGDSGNDVVQFDFSITSSNVKLLRPYGSDDLVITFTHSSDKLTLDNQFLFTQNSRYSNVEEIRFLNATHDITVAWTDEDIQQKLITQSQTANNDTIEGFGDADLLDGKAGNDKIYGLSGNDTLTGGTGNDYMEGSYGNDRYNIYANQGNDRIYDISGTDTVSFVNVTWEAINFSRLNDTQSVANLPGGGSIVFGDIENFLFSGSVSKTLSDVRTKLLIQGTTAGNDTIEGYSTNDAIIGGGGNDFLKGDKGNDIYQINKFDGNDIIEDSGGALDTIAFGTGITWNALTFTKSANHLIIGVPGNGSIYVAYGTSTYDYKIENFTFTDDPTSLPKTMQDVNERIAIQSTMFGNETIVGSYNDDTLIGGSGNDYMSGMSGNDVYKVNKTDGIDTIYNNSTSGNDTLSFGAGISWESLEFVHIYTNQLVGYADLKINISNGGSILLIDQFNRGASRIENFTFSDNQANPKTWLDIEARIVSEATTTGNDFISGFYGSDIFLSSKGNDTIYGYTGSDTFNYSFGDGNDVFDDANYPTYSRLGTQVGDADLVKLTNISSATTQFLRDADNALLSFSDGGSVELVNMFVNDGHRFETIQFSDRTFTWQQLWERTLDDASTDGYDNIYGHAIDDTIEGGRGNDYITTGFGSDTIIYNMGDGQDTVSTYAGNEEDRLILRGITQQDITITRLPTDSGIIHISDGGSIEIVGMFSNGTSKIESIELSDVTLSWQDIWQSTLNASFTDGYDIITGSDLDETIEGGLGNDTIQAARGSDTIIYNLGDGQDIVDAYSDNHDDTLQFGTGITLESLSFLQQGNHLLITMPDGGSLNLIQQYSGNGEAIEWFSFSGTTYSWAEIKSYIDLAGNATGLGTPDNDTLIGTASVDVIDALGGDDNVSGQNDNDYLSGNIGNDILAGNAGNDTLFGGAGADTLTGGTGVDMFLYTSLGDSAASSARDTISDFVKGEDKIDLRTLTFTGIHAGAASGSELGYTTSGAVTTITGAGGLSILVQVQNNGILDASDFIFLATSNQAPTLTPILDKTATIGTAFSVSFSGAFTDQDGDTLTYTTGSLPSWLSFDATNHTFSGTPTGSAGTVTVDVTANDGNGHSVSDQFNIVVSAGSSGFNNINGTIGSDSVLSGTAGADYIQGMGGLDTITGDDGNDSIVGGSVKDSIDGGNGHDTIVGGGGNDILRGRAGDDVYVYTQLSDSGNTAATRDFILNWDGGDKIDLSALYSAGIHQFSDLTITTVSGGDATVAFGTFTIVLDNVTSVTAGNFIFGSAPSGGGGFNNITGTSVNDTLSGTSAADYIQGLAGNDKINAGDGNDSLAGGDGNDTLAGELGVDTYDGGLGTDMIDFSGSTIGGSFNLVAQTVTASSITETMTSIEAVSGSSGNDTMTGSTGNNNLLGNGGNDTMNGGAGNDTVNGGDGNDTINGGDGNDLIIGFTKADTLTGGIGTDTFAYYSASHSSLTAIDTITDFVNDIDKIDLGGLNYTTLVAIAVNSTPTGTQLGYYNDGAGHTVLVGALNGGFEIILNGTPTIESTDIIWT